MSPGKEKLAKQFRFFANDPAALAYFALLEECLESCGEGVYIYRGQPIIQTEERGNRRGGAIASSLYRKYGNSPDNKLCLPEIEKKILERASRFTSSSMDDLERMALLRHYGQPLLLVDFSRDINIAIFFAAYSHLDEPGELIMYKADKVEHKLRQPKEERCDYIAEACSTHSGLNRAASQKSVFVRTPKGYIELDKLEEGQWSWAEISADAKPKILRFLKSRYNISIDTIYNDLFGFIKYVKNNDLASIAAGDRVASEGRLAEAAQCYTDAVDDNPLSREAYKKRSDIRARLSDRKGAREDREIMNTLVESIAEIGVPGDPPP